MIYLDNSATTRISEEALARYIEVSRMHFGNPSSRHAVGLDARKILKESRDAILRSVGGDGTVIFGASGSESDNLAIFGRAYAKERYRKGAKILTTAGEHAAVLQPLKKLESEGFRVVFIPTVGGVPDREVLMRELTPDVILVTVMAVNNETGALYDLGLISRMMRDRCPEAVLHTDATQSYTRVKLDAVRTGISMITMSSHKIEGPKGVSALYVSKELMRQKGLSPLIYGGGQEENLRSGTENLPGIAAFATAARIGIARLEETAAHEAALRARLLSLLREDGALSEVRPVLPPVSAPHILSLTLPSIKSEVMLNYLSARGICVSSGSACSSHDKHLSSALLAFGLSEREADCTIRVSLGRENTEADIDAFGDALRDGVRTLARTR